MMNHAIKVRMFDANPDNEPTVYEHFATEDSVSLKYIVLQKRLSKWSRDSKSILYFWILSKWWKKVMSTGSPSIIFLLLDLPYLTPRGQPYTSHPGQIS